MNSMSPCPTPNGYITGASPVDVRIKETDTALQDVTPSAVSKNIYSYDRFNNVTETDQYGFYGALYRKNIASYFSTGTIGGVSWDYWNIPTVSMEPSPEITAPLYTSAICPHSSKPRTPAATSSPKPPLITINTR